MSKSFAVFIPFICVLFGVSQVACSQSEEPADTGMQESNQVPTSGQSADEKSVAGTSARELPDDTIAMVGDQPITFNQVEIMLNSSAMIGMNIPPPGTPPWWAISPSRSTR